MENLKFTHSGKDYSYGISSHMVWKERNVVTIMMEDCGDNLFKWIRNNSTTGARHYRTDMALTDENGTRSEFKDCTLLDFSYSSVLNAYTVVVSYKEMSGQ